MLKWVVSSSYLKSSSSLTCLNCSDKSVEKHLREDSVLDNSDSVTEWQDSSLDTSDCDISYATNNTQIDCSSTLEDVNTCTNHTEGSSCSNCSDNSSDISDSNPNSWLSKDDTTARKTALSYLKSVATPNLSYTNRRQTKSLDLDYSELNDNESVVLTRYAKDTESLHSDDVFLIEENLNLCNSLHPRKVFSKRTCFQRKTSDEFSEHQNVHLKRSKLVEEIERENKLKVGAENLFKATVNRRLKQTVEIELKFIQSHIQLLTDQLSDLDTVMENKNTSASGVLRRLPMIQIGLKETKDVDFHHALKNFIEDHYFENGDFFHREIEEFETLRQMMRCPLTSEEGIALLYEYYNHLYFVDKRFFPSNRSIGVYFSWFDAITGTSSTQRTMGFEKGCVLFNIAALYSQIAAQKRRVCSEDCEEAARSLQKAAGVFKHLDESFSYAPSTDMQSHTLKVFISLMLAQAQECQFEILIQKENENTKSLRKCAQLAHESTVIYNMYKYCRQLTFIDSIKDYIPDKWHVLMQVKTLYYKALSNCYAAEAVLLFTPVMSDSDYVTVDDSMYADICDLFENCNLNHWLFNVNEQDTGLDKPAEEHHAIDCTKEKEEYLNHLAKACLSRAVLSLEEALRVHAEHQKLKRIPYYHDVHQLLKLTHDRCFQKYSELDEEDDFSELSSVPNIKALTSESISCISPEISHHKTEDLFLKLGPLHVFNAKHFWDEPKRIELHKKSEQEFGFSVRGEQPVSVAQVDANSIAEKTGLQAGDIIVQIGDQNTKWEKHQSMVQLIRGAGQHLLMYVITPLESSINPALNSSPNDKKVKQVMQSGTLNRNQQVRLSARSTKSLTFNFRKLKPWHNNADKKNHERLFNDTRKNISLN